MILTIPRRNVMRLLQIMLVAESFMDENIPGGLKFNLDSVLSRPEPGPTFPPLLLVTGQYYLTHPLCMVCGMIRMILRLRSGDVHISCWLWFRS